MSIRRAWRGGATALLALLAASAACRPASAEIIYATSVTTGIIYSDDTVTHVVTPVFNTGADIDSMFFDPSNRIIYDQLGAGKVLAFNPANNTNVTLFSQAGSQPIDLALEPNLTSFLVSDANNNQLDRISLAGGLINRLNVQYVAGQAGRPDGVIYDSAGRLFVNVSTGFTAAPTHLEQINPTTGAILQSGTLTGIFLDGLTYDSFTGMLWASDYNNGRVVEINPNNLSSFTVFTPTGAAIAGGGPDGIVSDGLGNLFIASRANNTIIQYNIATNTATAVGTVAGLDDLAPASGLGSVPEPSSALLLGIGGLGLLAYRLRRRAGGTGGSCHRW
jgi:sugar lactone lactonase YvrE